MALQLSACLFSFCIYCLGPFGPWLYKKIPVDLWKKVVEANKLDNPTTTKKMLVKVTVYETSRFTIEVHGLEQSFVLHELCN